MKKLIQTGVIGSIITALCCFTPVLVWILSAIGLASVIVYLDMVLFPLLGFFVILIVIGYLRKRKKSKNT
jgi:mercuric ion transport protein